MYMRLECTAKSKWWPGWCRQFRRTQHPVSVAIPSPCRRRQCWQSLRTQSRRRAGGGVDLAGTARLGEPVQSASRRRRPLCRPSSTSSSRARSSPSSRGSTVHSRCTCRESGTLWPWWSRGSSERTASEECRRWRTTSWPAFRRRSEVLCGRNLQPSQPTMQSSRVYLKLVSD